MILNPILMISHSLSNPIPSNTQTFHLVEARPWPFTAAFSACTIMYSFSIWFHQTFPLMISIGVVLIAITILVWWRDVIRESTYIGSHSYKVRRGLEWGIILFIISEVIFFSAFFWTFFHSSLAPTYNLGCIWPPRGIEPLNPFSIPLLNTGILLGSGITVTYAHHRLIAKNWFGLTLGLAFTVILGAYFSFLQAIEYLDSGFRFADRAYGSTFFIATGFHGIHVIIGSLFLLVTLIRAILTQISNFRHFGLEAASWYWHFVDVVWLFLFITIYWWAIPN